MLSDSDIETLSEFIQKGVKMIEIYGNHNVLFAIGQRHVNRKVMNTPTNN